MSADSKHDRLRVGFISQWFPPEPVIVPTNIFDELSREFDAVAITGQPNYPEGVLHEGFKATGVSYREENGRKVHRTPLYPSHSDSTFGRILNYCSWATSSAFLARKQLCKSDINFVYASPIMAALPAMLAKVTHGVPYVLNVQDLWPDSVFATGFITSGPIRKLAEWSIGRFADTSYRMASAVITISPGMGKVLEARGVDPSKIHLVYNWADESIIEGGAGPVDDIRAELSIPPSSRILVYAGNVGPAQGLHRIVDALADLVGDEISCHLVIIGDGVELPRIRSLVQELSLEEYVSLVGRIAPAEVPRFLRSADASLVSLGDSELFKHTMPSKVQSILACGSPIFVVGEGDVAEIATMSGAGWATSSEPELLVRTLRDFAADVQGSERRTSATSLYFGEMSRITGIRKLASILKNAAI